MSKRARSYRLFVAAAVISILVLAGMSWALRQTMRPKDEQRVQATSAQSPFDAERSFRELEKIVAIGPRVAGTKNSVETQKFIIERLEQGRVKVQKYPFEASTPLGTRSMMNIVGVVEGSEPGVIILGNHYDTKYLPDIDFVGANDGGSSTAWMIEMARALGPQRQRNDSLVCVL